MPDENHEMSLHAVNKRALRILYSTYWSTSGWKKDRTTPPADFAYAKNAGIMFDTRFLTHDEGVRWALNSRARVSKTQVAEAFLASLTSRRLDWRSALGTYAVSLHFPDHRWTCGIDAGLVCPVCGGLDSNKPQDLSIMNFERFKWSGVRHIDPAYIGFDLEQLSITETSPPTEADRAMMRSILSAARSQREGAKLADLTKALAKILPSSIPARRVLIGILGFSGILCDPSKPGFIDGFPGFFQRPEVPWYENQWPYPVEWWNGSHGVSEKAVAFWFPDL
jgi:hypothetical protein